MSSTTSHILSAKIVVRNREGCILLLRRSQDVKQNPGKWDLPGSEVEPGEAFDHALLRHVREETGLSITLTEPLGTYQLQKPDSTMVVYLMMAGDCADGVVQLSAEHDKHEWVHLGNVMEKDVCGQLVSFLTTYIGEHTPAREYPPARLDVKWFNRQVGDYRREQPKYKRLADVLKTVLTRASDRYAPWGLVNARDKAIQSFAEKAIRKQAKYHDPCNQLTDLAGGRLVTYTQAEVGAVCRWIEEEPGFTIDWPNSLNTQERLRPGEFGYSAKHYVVQLTGPAVLDIEIEPGLRDLKCELQVVTYLQHVWAAIGHDRLYKTRLQIPDQLKRQAAEVAALLESADESFSHLVDELDQYRYAFDPCLSPRQLDEEIERWQAVYRADPIGRGSQSVVHRIGRLLILAGRADEAYQKLTELSKSDRPDFRRDLGRAAFLAGRREEARLHLDAAIELGPRDPLSHCYMGDIDRSSAPSDALQSYSEAHRLAPEEPRVLVPLVECDLRVMHDSRILDLMRGSLESGIEECKRRASLRVYMPQVLFEWGRLGLYLNPDEPYDGLAAYAKAIASCQSFEPLCQEIETLELIMKAPARGTAGNVNQMHEAIPGLVWVRDFLELAIAAQQLSGGDDASDTDSYAAKSPTHRSNAHDRLSVLATPEPDRPAFEEPVLIVAGGCDVQAGAEIAACRQALQKALDGFEGTVICGGTDAGISGLVADLLGKRDGVKLLGYLPETIPDEDRVRDEYENMTTRGSGYTPLGPIQTWADLLLAGIPPQDVRVLGINGGRLAGFEYRLGLALGAVLGIVRDTGREVEKLLPDPFWNQKTGFAPLPRDWAALAAFIRSALPDIEKRLGSGPSWLEPAAQSVHRAYRESNLTKPGKVPSNVLPWARLPESLKNSNRQQAAYAVYIIRRAGFDVAPLSPGDSFPPALPPGFKDTVKEELMSRMEHGRYLAERLSTGWRLGDENDPARRTNPTLVAWERLSDEIKQYDVEAVRNFPYVLWLANLKIVKRNG